MLAAAQAWILPALRLYLLGLKVLLVQLFRSSFRLPGQFNTSCHLSQRLHLVFSSRLSRLVSSWLVSVGDARAEPRALRSRVPELLAR